MRFFGSRVRAGCGGLRRYGALLLGVGLSVLASPGQAAALTAIHDYRYLVNDPYPSLAHQFEGLTFTADGSLWAAIAPNLLDGNAIWKLDLTSDSVAERIPDTFRGPSLLLQLLQLVNPAALTAAGGQLIVGENYHFLRASQYHIQENDIIWAFTPGTSTPDKPDWSFSLAATACDGVEGAAFAAGKLYVSCGADQTIVEIDAQRQMLTRKFSFDSELLGIEAIDATHLIVGDYTNHQLRVFDLAEERFTATIDLNSLFSGRDSDYFRLTGEEYSVQVTPSEGYRSIPDPDGLAYRNGKIYMAFDGDLRIFEISMSVPEPGTLLLFTAALTYLASGRRRNRAAQAQASSHFA